MSLAVIGEARLIRLVSAHGQDLGLLELSERESNHSLKILRAPQSIIRFSACTRRVRLLQSVAGSESIAFDDPLLAFNQFELEVSTCSGELAVLLLFAFVHLDHLIHKRWLRQ
jgi:hypothetical protein